MTTRYTRKDLDAIVTRINKITKSPLQPYTDRVANVGNYHISGAYGGVALHRMANESGGVTDVLRVGHVPKAELARLMFAFIEGIAAAETIPATKP